MPQHEQDFARRMYSASARRASPWPLRSNRPQMGWASIANGELIKLAEADFDVFVTVDKGILYQQNLRSTVLGFILLRAQSNRLEDLIPLVADMFAALATIKAGDIVQLERHRGTH